MIREGKIGFYEIFSLLLLSNIAKIYISAPANAVADGRTLVWALIIIGTLVSILSFWIIATLMKKYEGKTIVEVAEEVLGPYLGTVFNLVFFLFFIGVMSILARGYSEAFLVSTLPRTPISVVLTALFMVSFASCYFGLETMARVARIILTFVLVGMGILFISILGYTDITRFYPILSVEPIKLLTLGLTQYSLVSEGVIAAIIILAISGGWQQFYRVGIMSLAVGGGIFLIVSVLLLLVFGVPSSNELILPFFELSRIVEFGRFFQRLEAIFLLTWAMVGVLKLSITLYAATLVAARMLRVPDYRPLLWVITLLCYILSIMPPDLPTTSLIEVKYIRGHFGIIATVLLPLLLLVVAMVKKSGGKYEDTPKNAKK